MVKQKQPPQKPFRWGVALLIIGLLGILGIFFAAIIALTLSSSEFKEGNVAVISVTGVIATDESDSFGFEDAASSTEIVKLIEEADQNPAITAIVLDINSPGGSPVASAEIADALKHTNKTTVAWIRDIGTSGAYWVASASDHIIAHKASITGSIGVIASYLEFNEFIERYNITYRRLVSGEYKDIGSPFKEMSESEQRMFQKNLDALRDMFIEEVAQNRKLSKSEVSKIATGAFYLGREALSLGLVDELGGKYEVREYIEKKNNIKVEFVEYETEKGLLEILAGTMYRQSLGVGRGIGSMLVRERRPAIAAIS